MAHNRKRSNANRMLIQNGYNVNCPEGYKANPNQIIQTQKIYGCW